MGGGGWTFFWLNWHIVVAVLALTFRGTRTSKVLLNKISYKNDKSNFIRYFWPFSDGLFHVLSVRHSELTSLKWIFSLNLFTSRRFLVSSNRNHTDFLCLWEFHAVIFVIQLVFHAFLILFSSIRKPQKTGKPAKPFSWEVHGLFRKEHTKSRWGFQATV